MKNEIPPSGKFSEFFWEFFREFFRDALQKDQKRATVPCPNGCGYAVTWHKSHCCNKCAKKGRRNGNGLVVFFPLGSGIVVAYILAGYMGRFCRVTLSSKWRVSLGFSGPRVQGHGVQLWSP